MSLDYIHLTHFVKLAALVSLFASVIGSHTFAQEPYQRRVRKFEMPKLGIANPAGLAFSLSANAFIVAPNRDDADLGIVTFAGELGGSESLATAIAEPVNMAFDGKANSLLFFDANIEELVEIKAGTNGRPRPTADAISRFNGRLFNAKPARGMTIDPETGDIFILIVPGQPTAPRIVRITPDPRNRFDGAVVSSIALDVLQRSELRGIAFNPSDGHLYVMSPAEKRLYEINQKGEVLTTRDLSSFEFSDAQNMVFAPSGDQTDDPTTMSLYVADNGLSSTQGLGDITELSLTQPTVLDLSTVTEQGTLIQTILTSQWSPPSPDPSGVAYISSSNTLIIADGEVDEMPIFAGINYWEVDLSGNQISEFSTAAFSDEPADVAQNPNNQHLFFSDDSGIKRVYELNPGPDGLYDTTDDLLTSFRTVEFSSTDPEGIAYDPVQGHLFIADGTNAEVYEISPGANGRFDGVPPSADDVVVHHFDTSIFGLHDPEGVEFNSDNGNLYIVSNGAPNGLVVETTRAGTLVGAIDISFLDAKSPAGLTHAPSSVNPSERSLYIVARGVDNNTNPDENDGKIYEISLGATPTKTAIFFQDGAVGYSGTRDTKLLRETPASNYGSSITLEVDGTMDRSTLLYWDLAAIPAGSIIQSVAITLNVNNPYNEIYEIYQLKRAWVEGEASWNEFAAGRRWQVAGANGSKDMDSTVLGVMANSTEGLSTFSLNSSGVAVVQSWVDDPATNNGFIIVDYVNTTDGLNFSSRENDTVSKRPKLTLTYDRLSPVQTVEQELPRESRLKQNYPNPFNPTTKISYSIPRSGFVTLKIHDVLGNEVQTLVGQFHEAGERSLEFDASKFSSGTYFYTLRIDDDFVETRKMLFLR